MVQLTNLNCPCRKALFAEGSGEAYMKSCRFKDNIILSLCDSGNSLYISSSPEVSCYWHSSCGSCTCIGDIQKSPSDLPDTED